MQYLSKRYRDLSPYVPGEQPQGREYIKLNTNESPFPPAPGVMRALSENEVQSLNLYPDPDAREANKAMAAYFGLKPENVLLTNGSDEVLAFCFQAYCDEETPAVFADITYGFYKVFARIYCLPQRIIPLREDFTINPADYYNARGTVFIANPNAPTSLALPVADIEDILIHNASNIVVVDEAYVSFGAESAVPLIQKYDNLIVLQTMSKSRNLAGARIGYALANGARIAELGGMKFSFNPYSVNRLSLLAAAAAIQDEEYFHTCKKNIMDTRAYLVRALEERGFTVLPGCANFIFAKTDKLSGGAYYEGLKEKGVLVRHFEDTRIKEYVRITVGAMEQILALISATDEILGLKAKDNGGGR